MKTRLFLKLLLFLFPFALYFLVTVGSSLYVGEFVPLREVVALQMGSEPVLYGRAYWDDQYAYKLLAVRTRTPEVIVIGSSRVMQFRSRFLDQNSAVFYNAGGAARSIPQLREFLDALEVYPDLLIVGIDPHWLNPAFTGELEDFGTSGDFTYDRAMDTSWLVFQDMLAGKIAFDAVIARRDPLYDVPALGFNAAIRGNGFRNDGSRQPGDNLTRLLPVERRIVTDLLGLVASNPYFMEGSAVDERRMEELAAILRSCQERGIFVIGFAPPFAPGVFEPMIAGGRHGYITESAARLETLFRQFDFAYYDFSIAAVLGADDDDMLDNFHGSEYVSLLAYIQMRRDLPEVLGRYSDLEFLENAAQTAENRFAIFGNEF